MWRQLATILVAFIVGALGPTIVFVSSTRDLATEAEVTKLQEQISTLNVQIARLETHLGDLGVGSSSGERG